MGSACSARWTCERSSFAAASSSCPTREWAVLKQVGDKPTTLTPALIFADGAEALFRAIADAPTEPPK